MIIEKLKDHIPDRIYLMLSDLLNKFPEINSPLRLAHFLSQCDHESDGFRQSLENMNYSSDRLLIIFPKYFNGKQAQEYHREPERIANRVYAMRMGNGVEASGDGWRHRGRGFIQLTGKELQNKFLAWLGMPINSSPSVINDKYPLISAAWFFGYRSVWDKCDKATEQAVKDVSRAVNGGTIGLNERIELFNKYWGLLK